MARPIEALYVSYDGALEPLGQSQVLPYLRGLARLGVRPTLLSHEKPGDLAQRAHVAALRAELAAVGIRWLPLRYHKRPTTLATAYDILQGIAVGAAAVRRRHIAVVHASSYVPALVGLALKRLLGPRLLFDMRGLWADERIEGGIWPARSPLYKLAKRCERYLLVHSDAVVSQTVRGKREIESWPGLPGRVAPIAVIPTSVDLERFAPRPRAHRLQQEAGLEGRFVVAYLGSLGTWYLLDEMLACFRVMRAAIPNAHFLILTPAPPDVVHRAATQCGVARADYTVRHVEHSAVADWLSIVDLGLYFYRPAYSRLAASPTKLGEFLASGIPVLTNGGIGDTDAFLRDAGVAVLLDAFSDRAYAAAVEPVRALCADPEVVARCRSVAERHLSLDQAVARYYALYEGLARSGARGRAVRVRPVI
jgi:glycosyltransferase involved in cell wall biosynthesis